MNTITPVASQFWCVRAAMLLSLWANHANSQVPDIAQTTEVHGGLVIQLDASDTRTAAKLSLTGRYLIHVLDLDAKKVDTAREHLREDGHYGLNRHATKVDFLMRKISRISSWCRTTQFRQQS